MTRITYIQKNKYVSVSKSYFCKTRYLYILIDREYKQLEIIDPNTAQIIITDSFSNYDQARKKGKQYLKEQGAEFFDEVRTK